MGVIPPPPIPGLYNAIFNVGSMLVSAIVLIYLLWRVKKREYRLLFTLLILFSLTHAGFHITAGTGIVTQNIILITWGRAFFWPLSNLLLVVFGLIYLRRELKPVG